MFKISTKPSLQICIFKMERKKIQKEKPVKMAVVSFVHPCFFFNLKKKNISQKMLYFCFSYISGTLNMVYVNGAHSPLQLFLEKIEFPYELLHILNLFKLFKLLEFPNFYCIGALHIFFTCLAFSQYFMDSQIIRMGFSESVMISFSKSYFLSG